ncbi:MAG: hypothetical protein ACUVUQ_07515 [Thermodesulfovibrionales bacterium]
MGNLETKLKKYQKEQLIYSGGDPTQFNISRIPTGIFIMDILTGGGIPESRVTEFYGAKSTTKSSTVLRIAGNYERKYEDRHILLADFEGTYEREWGQRFIPDMDRLHVLVPDYGEQGIDVIKDMVNENEIGLLIIDSVANLIPLKEIEADAGDATVGLHAKLLNRLFRVLFPVMISRRKTGNPLTIIVVNQLRANVSSRKFQSPTIKPGGMMQDFLYSLDIRLYTTKIVTVGGLPAKSVHEFTIEKNKLGLQKRSGEFSMNLLNLDGRSPIGSIDELPTVLKYAIKAEIIARVGNKWRYGKQEFPNLESVKAALVTDSNLYNAVRQETLEICIKDVRFTAGEKEEE